MLSVNDQKSQLDFYASELRVGLAVYIIVELAKLYFMVKALTVSNYGMKYEVLYVNQFPHLGENCNQRDLLYMTFLLVRR